MSPRYISAWRLRDILATKTFNAVIAGHPETGGHFVNLVK